MSSSKFSITGGLLFGAAAAVAGLYGAWKVANGKAKGKKCADKCDAKSSESAAAAGGATASASASGKALTAVSGVLFDLDGTLIETAEIWYLVLRAASNAWGYGDLPREKWAPTYGQSMQANVSAFFPKHTLADLDAFVDANYDQFIAQHLVVLPGAKQLLRTAFARTGGRVACVTNCPVKLTARLLAHCGFDTYFGNRVVCAGVTVNNGDGKENGAWTIPPKPDPKMIAHAASLLGVNVAKCVLIGDSKYDMAAGTSAGVQTVGINVDGGQLRVAATADVLGVLTPVLPPVPERTFIALKPDAVQRGLIGNTIAHFESKGFKLVAMKLLQPTPAQAAGHYDDLKALKFFQGLCAFFSSGPIVAMVWEGEGVVSAGRKLMGATKPSESAPGTIRGNTCVNVGRNVIHGSDKPESAAREIAFWFADSELVDHFPTVTQHLYE